MVPELPTPPVTAKKAFPVSPAMAKRAVFAFYVLAVLCAWNTHMASSDLGTVCHPEPADNPEAIPEPAAGPKAIPEQPALHDMVTETITEQPALPDMATKAIEATLPCYGFALLCVWATHTSLLAYSAPALKFPESATATETIPESAPVPENCLHCAHYIGRASLGAVIFVVFPFLTLVPVLPWSDQPALLALPLQPALLALSLLPALSAPPKLPALTWPPASLVRPSSTTLALSQDSRPA